MTSRSIRPVHRPWTPGRREAKRRSHFKVIRAVALSPSDRRICKLTILGDDHVQFRTKTQEHYAPVESPAEEAGLGHASASEEDPFEQTSDNELVDQVAAVGKAISPIRPSQMASENPFRMTMTFGTTSNSARAPSRPASIEKRPVSRARASLDVDAFKRLLMTGTTTQMQQPAGKTINLSAGRAGSSTDTSSISRYSLFESIPEGQPDTPRTSHEISLSEDERRRVADDITPVSDSRRPPPPTHRHGQPVAKPRRAEAISSFSSDLNKPLPSPPTLAPTTQMEVVTSPVVMATDVIPSISASPSRRTPPKPPLSRQHSRAASHAGLSRTSSIDERRIPPEIGGPPPASRAREPLLTRRPPRPPPARRPTLDPRLNRSTSSSIGSTDGPGPPQSGISMEMPLSVSETPTSLALDRRPSTSSSATRLRLSGLGSVPSSASLTVTASFPPPPPPPRRSRGYSRDVVVEDGIPGAPIRSNTLPPSSSLSPPPPPPPPPTASSSSVSDTTEMDSSSLNAAMANLDALQQEVDELRRKFEKNKT